MILVVLEVNGRIKVAECVTMSEAENKAFEWKVEEKKNYPHCTMTFTFYGVVEIDKEIISADEVEILEEEDSAP